MKIYSLTVCWKDGQGISCNKTVLSYTQEGIEARKVKALEFFKARSYLKLVSTHIKESNI